MATSVSEFEPWLSDKLKSLKTDEGVFGSYISGILDNEDTIDDKKDALEGILSEIVDKDISVHVNEIIDKWEACRPKEEAPKSVADVDLQLAKLLESQALATTTRREYTDEEKKIREAILSQYSQLSDNEEDQENEEDKINESGDLVKNTNAADVQAAARERREQARQEAQRKKEKDKEDREKQKQMREEKKEKRKTQKGERKR